LANPPHLRVTQPRQQTAECVEEQQPGLSFDPARELIQRGQPGRSVAQGGSGIKARVGHFRISPSLRLPQHFFKKARRGKPIGLPFKSEPTSRRVGLALIG
jgi:hypothetical protein